jgi:hypothetical protein
MVCSRAPHAHLMPRFIVCFILVASSSIAMAESSDGMNAATFVDVALGSLGGVAYWEGNHDEHGLRWGAQSAIDGDMSTGWC